MSKTIVGLVWLTIGLAVVPAGAAESQDETEWNWFGTLRMRPEYNENLSDLSAGRDDKIGYVGYRANLGARIGLPREVSLLFDGQATGVWGEDQTPYHTGLTQDGSSAKFNFFQAYAEARSILGTKFSLRGGRQTLEFGDEWLMGDLDFYGGTSFDAIRGDFEASHGQTSLFWAKIAETNTPEMVAAVPDVGGDNDLYGLWSSWDLAEAHRLDAGLVYVLDHRTLSTSTLPFQDKRWTFAAEYGYGAEAGPFVQANFAWQWGTTLGGPGVADISASAGEVTGGYTWEINEGTYKLYGRLANYTGDEAGTQDREQFVPLFQDTHARYGYLDMWNGQWGFVQYLGGDPGFGALHLGFEARLPSGMRVTGYAQRIERDERILPTESNKQLGEEFGVAAGYDYGDNVSLEMAFSQLYPGTAIKLEPPLFGTSVTKRVYLNTVVRF